MIDEREVFAGFRVFFYFGDDVSGFNDDIELISCGFYRDIGNSRQVIGFIGRCVIFCIGNRDNDAFIVRFFTVGVAGLLTEVNFNARNFTEVIDGIRD